jgi:plastocyanin
MIPRILAHAFVVTGLVLAFAACGGGGGSPSSPASNDGPIAATIVIDATGAATPNDVTVPAGSRVTFTNNHSALHEMVSDPHPEHTLCPSLNSVGFLNAGQSKTSSNLNTPRVCTYHDHLNDTDARLRGTIRVQ